MKERLVDLAILGLSAYALNKITTLAFSRGSRNEVLRRANYMCEHCGESGSNTPLEAAHIDHTRGYGYDNPDNGMCLCMYCHLQDHVDRAGDNGLPEHYNEWAIKSLEGRISAYEECKR